MFLQVPLWEGPCPCGKGKATHILYERDSRGGDYPETAIHCRDCREQYDAKLEPRNAKADLPKALQLTLVTKLVSKTRYRTGP